MTCKLTQIVKDVLLGNKKIEEFVLVVDGKEYEVEAGIRHSLSFGEYKEIYIIVKSVIKERS